MNYLKTSIIVLIFLEIMFIPELIFPQAAGNMVQVKGGTFMMGCSSNETLAYQARYKPAHKMTVGDFYIARYEVTQAEYKSIMGSNPSRYKGDRLPVETVSWFDAVLYCNKLSEKEGLEPCYKIKNPDVECDFSANGFRLPAEAEWEYAARGGHLSKNMYLYAGSDNMDEISWYKGNSGNRTHEVGQKQPNELGLFDMTGNVTEWCRDRYEPFSEAEEFKTTGPETGKHKVEKGGMFRYEGVPCRIYYRHFVPPSDKYRRLGFRVCRSKM